MTVEATAASPSLANANTNDWRKWLERQKDNGRVITPTNVASSPCECCGGIWLSPTGMWKPYGKGTQGVYYRAEMEKQYTQTVQDVAGIYFGEYQDGATLLKHAGLPEGTAVFEIKDGKDTHSIAWKDA